MSLIFLLTPANEHHLRVVIPFELPVACGVAMLEVPGDTPLPPATARTNS